MELTKVIKRKLKNNSKKLLNNIIFLFIGISGALLIRILRPFILIRIGSLVGSRIGHFALNTELYICEKINKINTPKSRYMDFFYLDPENNRPICNKNLLKLWLRTIKIYPAWLLSPVDRVNHFIQSKSYQINAPIQSDRDIFNLIDKTPFTHLALTREEEIHGSAVLRKMGIPENKKFVCLIARDSAYLPMHLGGNLSDYEYHDYRDVDIGDYLFAAKKIAEMGYFVIRMGVKVHKKLPRIHSNIIDYAESEFRSEFMDIYLGAKCFFCISNGVGFDAIPYIYRRPIAYTNMVPFNCFASFGSQNIGIFKHHVELLTNKKLSIKESQRLGVFSATSSMDYLEKNIFLHNNTQEEIFDLCEEMILRLNGDWIEQDAAQERQKKFWECYVDASSKTQRNGQPLHGEVKAKIGEKFLKQNNYLME